MKELVVLLHGVWMPGAEMLAMKRRLESDGAFDCHLFSYRSVRGTLDDCASSLLEFVRSLAVPRLHFVGHSLGGIVTLRALASGDEVPQGRVVCLGSPLTGSKAARALVRYRWGRYLAGGVLPQGALTEPASLWAMDVVRQREVGVVAGNTPAGMGRLLARFNRENDGTVAVEETQLAGITDHVVLSVNHTGMVFSQAVAEQTAAFLRRGSFLHET